ncbi:MAG: LCP family protein [Mycobacterium sp.]
MDEQETQGPVPARRKSGLLAALLSFIWPGLGQAYRGLRRRAAQQALPPALALLALVVTVFTIGPIVSVIHLLNPVISLGAVALIAVLGVWRAFSIFDAARPHNLRAYAAATILIALVVASHAWLGGVALSFYEAGQTIHEPVAPGPSPSTEPPPASADPGSSPGANPTNAPTPDPLDPLPGTTGRVTVLLIGIDNTHTEDRGLTDTLMVSSFDPMGQSLTMISIPRDTGRLPYYAGGEYAQRINTLMQTAARNPDEYPDGPVGTLVNEVSYIVGVPIDYSARIDIAGFTTLVDAVGGIDVVLEEPINDPGYQFLPPERGFFLEAGPHHLDGKLATAYARSRHGAGNSDYDRAKRQQQILLALREKLNNPFIIANASALVSAVAQIIRTDAPLERLPEIVDIALRSRDAATTNIVLRPPNFAHSVIGADGRPTSMTQLTMDAVALLSVELFGTDSRYYSESH